MIEKCGVSLNQFNIYGKKMSCNRNLFNGIRLIMTVSLLNENVTENKLFSVKKDIKR